MKLSVRQQEVLLALELGWFILHTPINKRPYILRKCVNGVWRERELTIPTVESLINKDLIEITGIHGVSAQMRRKQ